MKRLITLVAAATILFPAVAHASCPPSDALGSWQVYSMSVSGEGVPDWVRCRINIRQSGFQDRFVIDNTHCVSRYNSAVALTFGRGKLGASCAFTGHFNLGGLLNTVNHGTLSIDKQSANGVGSFPGGGMFIFNMTRLD